MTVDGTGSGCARPEDLVELCGKGTDETRRVFRTTSRQWKEAAPRRRAPMIVSVDVIHDLCERAKESIRASELRRPATTEDMAKIAPLGATQRDVAAKVGAPVAVSRRL